MATVGTHDSSLQTDLTQSVDLVCTECIAQWCNGEQAVILVLLSAVPLHVTSLGKLFTNVPLSRSSMIWYQPDLFRVTTNSRT